MSVWAQECVDPLAGRDVADEIADHRLDGGDAAEPLIKALPPHVVVHHLDVGGPGSRRRGTVTSAAETMGMDFSLDTGCRGAILGARGLASTAGAKGAPLCAGFSGV